MIKAFFYRLLIMGGIDEMRQNFSGGGKFGLVSAIATLLPSLICLLVPLESTAQYPSTNLQTSKTSPKSGIECPDTTSSSPKTNKGTNQIISRFDPQNIARQLLHCYLEKRAIDHIRLQFTPEQADQIQAALIQQLIPHLGQPIGYKAGLTNPLAQEKFNVTQPILGTLLEKMLLKSGATITANFGAIPMFEADLIVKVGSDDISQAKTPEEILSHLEAVIPFLELPDLQYSPEVQLNASLLTIINVGARLGVVGEAIPLNQIDNWQTRLSQIQVTIYDETGGRLASGNSKDLLGDPLNVVFWIKNQLDKQGKALKKGDLLSLGTITPLTPAKAGESIRAEYIGLMDKPVEITVNFVEKD